MIIIALKLRFSGLNYLILVFTILLSFNWFLLYEMIVNLNTYRFQMIMRLTFRICVFAMMIFFVCKFNFNNRCVFKIVSYMLKFDNSIAYYITKCFYHFQTVFYTCCTTGMIRDYYLRVSKGRLLTLRKSWKQPSDVQLITDLEQNWKLHLIYVSICTILIYFMLGIAERPTIFSGYLELANP